MMQTSRTPPEQMEREEEEVCGEYLTRPVAHKVLSDACIQVQNVGQPVKRHYKLIPGDKVRIMALRAGGMSWTNIGKLLNIDRRTAARCHDSVIQRKSYERKRGTGRIRKTSSVEDLQIMSHVRSNRFCTSQDVKLRFPHVELTARSIRRRINELSDFSSYWCTRKPYINEVNRCGRVAWAREHLKWTREQWHKVLWSDESPYILRVNQRVQDEAHDPCCTSATVKHDEKIMVWGCFAARGIGHLHRIEGIMNKNMYVGILEDHMYPSAVDLFDEEEWIFQEDNDPKHTSRLAKEWTNDQGIYRMSWPAQSPDLNPIENLWAILDSRLKDHQPGTKEELFEVLKAGWNSFDRDLLTGLVDSMPARCQAVIDSEGYATKY